MPVDPGQLDRALDAIRKEYGPNSIKTGDQKPNVARIPTGSVELDWATGGGIPIGRWSHFYGGFSSSKTLSCWNVIENAQAMGKTCAYYNIEKQFDPAWIKKRGGIDLKKLLVVEGATIEGVGKKLDVLLSSIHVHVIDSLAQAVSIEELNASIEDHSMGLAARTWGKVIRRANERFDDNENVVIMVNQVRDVFGRGGGEAPPGGKFIDFTSSLSLHFRRSGWLHRNANGNLDPDATAGKGMSGDSEPEGIEFVVRVVKSRVCSPLRVARLRLDFETGRFDELWALTKGAKHFQVVEQTSPGRYVLEDGTKIHGEPKLREAIAADPILQDKVKTIMLSGA